MSAVAGVRTGREGSHLGSDNLPEPRHPVPRVTDGAMEAMEGDALLGAPSTGEEERALPRAQNRLFTGTVLSSHIKATTTLR